MSRITRALLRLERTMNLLEGGRGREDGGERVGRGWREGGWGGDVGERGRVGRVGEGRGGMTVIHIIIGMFTSNPMIPQYLNNNLI